jgi:hypothetical protein
MAKVEIDETELATYRQVFTAVRQGLANPKTRTKLLEVQAELTPEATSPEITLWSSLGAFKTEILGELSKLREETTKEKTDREERDSRDRLNARWSESQAVARAAGYTPEGLEKLEKFMETHGVADHRIAIPAFERENPPPQPVTTGGQRWDFFGAKETRPPDLKALLEGDEDSFLAQAIPEALGSVRNQR